MSSMTRFLWNTSLHTYSKDSFSIFTFSVFTLSRNGDPQERVFKLVRPYITWYKYVNTRTWDCGSWFLLVLVRFVLLCFFSFLYFLVVTYLLTKRKFLKWFHATFDIGTFFTLSVKGNVHKWKWAFMVLYYPISL